MTVGFFSPLPPARTGVADYSAALLRALAALGPVKVNDRHADVCLYHLGNNRLHREIYQRALDTPGVVVLHDAVLHHFLLGELSEPEYVAEFVYNYGAWNEDLARDLWRRRARSATDPQYFSYPMLKRVAERSRAVVVHNPAAARMVLEHAPGAVVHEIPHLFEPPEFPAPAEVIRLRHELGLAPRIFLFAVFGHLRESKRLLSVLRAYERVRRESEMALLVAGDFVSSDLARAAEPLLLPDRGILRTAYQPERDFWRYALATDACINLRYPAAGETSGISIRLMGAAKPVLVSAGLETSGFPQSACLRVDTGVGEEDLLAEYMLWLARFPSDAQAIGQRAAAHIGEFHAPARVAALYWRALAGCYDRDQAGSAIAPC
ncbi:MAG: glycosyltransferase [Acidobacteriia bacterium]|nr:glycosyltransferase [Terriglobia bacterium]